MGPRTLKRVLKRIAADMLPHEIAHRGKHGFSMPVQRWLASDLADYARDVLLSSRAQQRGLVKPEYVHDLLRTHADSPSTQPSRQVWALLCLELWFQAYMDPGTPAAGTRSYIQAGS
jgi:asparagine synthase (glutamine-hydrolysing)